MLRRRIVAPWFLGARSFFAYGPSEEALKMRGEARHAEDRYDPDDEDAIMDVDAAHVLLSTTKFDSMARIKLSYLLKCRQHHPEVGGDPNMYYKVNLAYECLMAERGIEMRNGVINHSDMLPKRRREERLLANVTRPTLLAGAHDILNDIDRYKHLETGDKPPLLQGQKEDDHRERSIHELSAEERQKLEAGGTATTPEGTKEKASSSATEGSASDGPSAQFVQTTENCDNATNEELAAAKQATKQELAAVKSDAPQAKTVEGDLQASNPNAVNTPTEAEKPRALSHAAFDQKTVEHLSRLPQDLTSETKLAPEEEEAVVRRILAEEMDEGPLAKETVMDYLEKSVSVAGFASRTSTEIMYNTKERQQITQESMLLYVNLLVLFLLSMTVWFAYKRYLAKIKNSPQLREHINVDTLLPWWGNDDEYERQVKRLFVDEWNKARASSQREKHRADGAKKTSLDQEARDDFDQSILQVSPQDLEDMQSQAQAYRDRRTHRAVKQ